HDAPRQVLARKLPALEIEAVAIAVVRRAAEDADAAIVLEPAQLPIVGDVAPYQIAALRVPGWPFHPERAGPQPLDGGVGLAQPVEARIDGDDVGIREVGRRGTARAEIARWRGDGGRRRNGPAGYWRRRLGKGAAGGKDRGGTT